MIIYHNPKFAEVKVENKLCKCGKVIHTKGECYALFRKLRDIRPNNDYFPAYCKICKNWHLKGFAQ